MPIFYSSYSHSITFHEFQHHQTEFSPYSVSPPLWNSPEIHCRDKLCCCNISQMIASSKEALRIFCSEAKRRDAFTWSKFSKHANIKICRFENHWIASCAILSQIWYFISILDDRVHPDSFTTSISFVLFNRPLFLVTDSLKYHCTFLGYNL